MPNLRTFRLLAPVLMVGVSSICFTSLAVYAPAATEISAITLAQAVNMRPPEAPPEYLLVRTDFQVCKQAEGSCAGCHYFIPNSPPGCGGLMIMKRPQPGTVNPHTGRKTPAETQAKPGDVWRAHPGAGPIAATHDIPLPTCFPCPPGQNVLENITLEVAGFPGLEPAFDGPMEPIIIFPPPLRSPKA